MGKFTEFERDRNAGVGVRWEDFITAVGMYVYTNESRGNEAGSVDMITVAKIAEAFNTTEALAREAVEDHPWLFKRAYGDVERVESDGD